MRRDLAGIDEGNPLSRGPSGPLRSSKSGKNQTTSAETTHNPSTDLAKAKRMRRDLAFREEENPLSRGPSGPLRSSKSGKIAPLRSRRPVTYRGALPEAPP